jgi:AraC-like DNA-binding protein
VSNSGQRLDSRARDDAVFGGGFGSPSPVFRSCGLVRIDQLAAELGWSRKRLWSRFHSQIGLPPKRAAKLVRFDHAARLLAAGLYPARVAADCGYTDRSHLHRDVTAFTGVTPATMAGELGGPNSPRSA